MDDGNEFGKLLQKHRERAGLTQEELAIRIGVSQQSIAKYESGKAFPRPSVILQLGEVLKTGSHTLPEILIQTKEAAYEKKAIQTGRDIADKSSTLGDESSTSNFPAIENLSHESLTAFPVVKEKRRDPTWYRGVLAQFLKENFDENGKWGCEVRGGSLTWIADYMTDDFVVQFRYILSWKRLVAELQGNIQRILWKYATLRAHLKDRRSYLFIITMPPQTGYEPDNNHLIISEMGLRQLITEAALLDISVFVTHSPKQVLSLLTSLNAGDDDSERSLE